MISVPALPLVSTRPAGTRSVFRAGWQGHAAVVQALHAWADRPGGLGEHVDDGIVIDSGVGGVLLEVANELRDMDGGLGDRLAAELVDLPHGRGQRGQAATRAAANSRMSASHHSECWPLCRTGIG